MTSAPALTLATLAALDHDAFVGALGDLFEHSPWVAQAAWQQRPFASERALHDAMMAAVRAASQAQQIAFLNLHPELAGKEAQAGTMTGHSTFEQHGAGLNALSHEELLELRRLNAAYLERHGFPFIIAVLGHTKAQIFEALRTRAGHDTPRELNEALHQIAQITRRRLHARFADA
jgi:2-oxo-4-hydroxy-4-carboxy-5-ureidoimidazoline decarboxylase